MPRKPLAPADHADPDDAPAPKPTGETFSPRDARRRAAVLPRALPRVTSYARISVPVLWLRYAAESSRRDVWRLSQRAIPAILREAVGKAEPGEIHAAIDALVLPLTRTRLYVGERDEPLYCVVIHRGDDGLWRTETDRVRGVAMGTSGHALPKDGVMMDVPIAMPQEGLGPTMPALTRVWGGGLGAARTLKNVQEDYEIRRMVSHAWIVARLLGGVGPSAAFPVHLPMNGRASFAVEQDGGNGWVTPFDLRVVRTGARKPRRAVEPAVKAVFVDEKGGANMETALFPSYVLPHVREDLLLAPIADEPFLGAALYRLCATLFRAGLMPWTILVARRPATYFREIEEGGEKKIRHISEEKYRTLSAAVQKRYALLEGDRYQRWVAPSYVPSKKRVEPFVVREGRFLHDAAPKIHLLYDERWVDLARTPEDGAPEPQEDLEARALSGDPDVQTRRVVSGLDPNRAFFGVLLDLLCDDETRFGGRKRVDGATKILYSLGYPTLPKMLAAFRDHKIHLSESRLALLRERID